MGNVRLVKFQWKGVGHLSEWSIPYGFDVARKEVKCDFLFLKQAITHINNRRDIIGDNISDRKSF